MKDLPVFTTEYGVASLILREIPYQQTAYIRLQASQEPQKLLKECVDFCRMVGAEKILVKETEVLEGYPLFTAIWQMRCMRSSLADTDAALFPVQEHTADEFQRLYNQKVSHIPNAAWMDNADKQEMLKTGEFTIAEVADSIGSSSVSNFSRDFKKHFGITPSSV